MDAADEAYARAAVGEVLAEWRLRDGARVRLTGDPGGSARRADSGPRPPEVLVQVNLRVHGAPVRVQLACDSATRAVDLAAERLRRQVRRLVTAYESWPWPDPERPPLAVPFAGALRRRKAYRLPVGSPCQATAFMNAMDYDVMLFTDAETGEDAVVYRSGPTGLRLSRQRTMRPPSLPGVLPLTVHAHRVPSLTPADAAQRLVEGWLPHIFFTDSDTGRGSLIYRRYDGDLAQIIAA
jgi:hypothetical protein